MKEKCGIFSYSENPGNNPENTEYLKLHKTRSKVKFDYKNRRFWEIVKGISITNIVIGHFCDELSSFVYLFHLVIFFFTSGWLYSEDKYGDCPHLYFAKRIQGTWLRWSMFAFIFVLLHNELLEIGMICNAEAYSLNDKLSRIYNSFIFMTEEAMGGAMWFVPCLIIASMIFEFIIFFSRRAEKAGTIIKNLVILTLGTVSALLGMRLIYYEVMLFYRGEIAFLVIPFFITAYFLRINIKDADKFLKIYFFIPVAVFLYIIAYKMKIVVDLAMFRIGDEKLFYIFSLAGIYFCLYLGKLLYKLKIPGDIMAVIGRYSFEIMAMHFFVGKIIDLIYAYIAGINDKSVYSFFPTPFNHLWLLHTLFGTVLPAALFYTLDKCYSRLMNLMKGTLSHG